MSADAVQRREFVFIKRDERESRVELPDGRTIVAATLGLQGSDGTFWESIPDSYQTFFYIDGEPVERATVEAVLAAIEGKER